MEILSNFDRIQHASCRTCSNIKNSNEILKSCLFNSANRVALARTVGKIQTVKDEAFCTTILPIPTNRFNQSKSYNIINYQPDLTAVLEYELFYLLSIRTVPELT